MVPRSGNCRGTLAASKQRLAETAERFGTTKTQARKYEQVLSIPRPWTRHHGTLRSGSPRQGTIADAMDALKNKGPVGHRHDVHQERGGARRDNRHRTRRRRIHLRPRHLDVGLHPGPAADGEHIVKAAAVAKHGRHRPSQRHALRGRRVIDYYHRCRGGIDTLMPSLLLHVRSCPSRVLAESCCQDARHALRPSAAVRGVSPVVARGSIHSGGGALMVAVIHSGLSTRLSVACRCHFDWMVQRRAGVGVRHRQVRSRGWSARSRPPLVARPPLRL